MICSNCKMRWAPLPETWPNIPLTKQQEKERSEAFENNEVVCCPVCGEELDAYRDYLDTHREYYESQSRCGQLFFEEVK